MATDSFKIEVERLNLLSNHEKINKEIRKELQIFCQIIEKLNKI